MMYNKNITKEKLTEYVDEWAKKVFGPTFKYRPKQKETAVDIMYDWLNGTDNVVLDAPTGSGKSVIAMTIGGVLSEYFNKRGYILISDLSLLEQYQNDISVYLPEWGIIRGQQTYTCLVNGLNFKVGVCKLQGASSYNDIISSYPECAPFCEYIVERQKAITAPVTCCTYTHWLLQQNYVKPKMIANGVDEKSVPFGTRDFVICDEAHKLVNIVQSHFSPRFGKNDMTKIKNIVEESNLTDKTAYVKSLEELRHEIYLENDKSKLIHLLAGYRDLIHALHLEATKIKAELGDSKEESKHLSKSQKTLLYDCEFVFDHFCKFDDYVPIIERIGSEYLVKNDKEENDIVFNCINESYLMNRTFHANCKKRLYMSATIGDPDKFATETAFKNYKYYKLPIVFDYSKSPIFYVPDYKMSYREKEASFPYITKMIGNIINMYAGKRGIVQTGSYSFAKQLKDGLPPEAQSRVLLYEDSAGKQDNLEVFKYSTDKILIGPSLIEGLSLNDDLCRFQIIMKVPYPSLADKFISAKRDFNPQWYSDTTTISVLQGVGRGVRSEKDWCVTFILDGCFNNLLSSSRSMFPQEFIDRIQIVPSSTLLY